MKVAGTVAAVSLLLASFPSKSQDRPAYVREGDRVEQRFRGHRDRLTTFFQELRAAVQREAPASEAAPLLRRLQEAPPQTNRWGYQMLPRIVDIPQPPTPISNFSYSWGVTESYVTGENTRLERAQADLARVAVVGPDEKLRLLGDLVAQYREMVKNQRTVDQYIQYNRFWQREIAEDRPRFDRLTQVYTMMKSGSPDIAEAIRGALGKPKAPRFIQVRRQGTRSVTLQVRVYTDIDDDAYLDQAKAIIESVWRAEEGGMQYAVEVVFRKRSVKDLYRNETTPQNGDHIDLDRHVARFPSDGGVLTTGAQFTFGSVGRYVGLGPGELAPRTLAHEFGHILGFTDGYIRGYADLGERGFEILELTSFFDDIMSAPREGRVQPAHFKLLMESLGEP
jgi:hypothetical protein